MDTLKKKAKVWLCIAIGLMLLSMVAANIVQSSSGTVTVKDLRWETTQGLQMSGLLFVPDGASADNKLPTIVTSHGMFNNREMQDANFVELSRRGFVVLSMDMFSHGLSEDVPFIGGILTGMYEAVKMVSTLPYVDTERIGITGHSLGGMSSNTAISQDNAAEQPLIAAVYLNCADATYVDGEGNFTDVYGTRAAGIMAAQYDEFFMTQTIGDEETSPTKYLENSNAQSFLYFGTDPAGTEPRLKDTFYTQEVNGVNALRIINNPAITHPWSHFSKRATAAVIEFFDEAFTAPTAIDSGNQVWQWKEFWNLLGLIGFAMFAVNFAILMVFTKFFSSLQAKEPVAPRALTATGAKWFWGSLVIAAVFGTLVYLPIMNNFNTFTMSADPWPQSSPWGISVWAAVTGVFAIILMLLSYYLFGKKNGVSVSDIGVTISVKNALKTILLAVIVVGVTYAWVFFADYFFKTDFRIWVLATKAFDSSKIFVSLFPYLPLFLIYYVAQSVATNAFNYNTLSKRPWVNTAVVAAFSGVAPLVLLLIQYVTFFSTGFMAWPASNMVIVWLFPILVILPATTIMSRKIYKATNNPYLPGLINGIIITLIACSNTLTWG